MCLLASILEAINSEQTDRGNEMRPGLYVLTHIFPGRV